MSKQQNHLNDKVTPIQSDSYQSIVDRVIKVYETLNADSLDQLDMLYSQDVYFEDPAHAIQGLCALRAYFKKLITNVDHCQFRFHNTLYDNDRVFLNWTMTLKHPRLRGDEKIFVEGTSLLKVRGGSVYYHRDYFDLGSMLYEHLPVLGYLIKQIKKGLVS